MSNKSFPYELQYYIAKALADSEQDTHIKTAIGIFEHLYQSNWDRAGLKKDYAFMLSRIGKTETAKRLLCEEYDEFSDLSALQNLIHIRLLTNSNIDDKYFRSLLSYCDSNSLFLTGEVFLKRKEYQQAYNCYLRSLLVDESNTASCFGVFQISIHNKLPCEEKNSRGSKIVVLADEAETRKIAIHSPNVLHGINPTTFAGCEHYSIEDPTVSCLVFSNVNDNVSFGNKQYVVKDITSLQDEMVRKCYKVVLNNPNVTTIKGETAEDFISAIKPILKSSNDAITTVLADYNNAPLQMPLTSLAKATGKSMLEISEFLMFGNKGKIRNNQNGVSFDTANTTPSFVFAYDALVRLFELKLPIPDNRRPICSVQVRDHLTKDIDDDMRDMLSDNHPGSMVYRNNDLTIMEYTQATRQDRYLHRSKLKDFLRLVDSPNISYDYQPKEDEIGVKLAEIVLGNNMFCESGSLGLAQNLDNAVLVTDDQMLYATADFSGIRNCGIIGFLSASGYTWDQLLSASKKLRNMNFSNYLPFELYKTIVDSMLEEGVEVEKRSVAIQDWVRSDTEDEPSPEHKDIILALYRDVIQSRQGYLDPHGFLSELAAYVIEERNPGMLQQLWEKARSSLPQIIHEVISQSIELEES